MALKAFGEFDIADRANNLTDAQVLEIGKMSMAFISTNRLVDKTLALAAVEYFEGEKRELKKNRRDMKYYNVDVEKDEGFFWTYIKTDKKKITGHNI